MAVGTLNNDRTVMSKPYAWRVLACLPILKGSACTNTSREWQTQRRLALYHKAMAPIIDEVNEICYLDSSDDTYPLRHTASVRIAVEKARTEHLNADGSIKDRHKEKVFPTN